MAKSARQLNREIAEVLARKPRSRRHHAIVQAVKPSDAWDVVKDALLEDDPVRAATIARDIKKEHGLSSLSDDFIKALRKIPKHIREAFESKAGIVTKQNYDWGAFAAGAADAYWGDTYASEVENLEYDETRRALSPGAGGNWEDVMPAAPAVARSLGKKFAKEVKDQITVAELNEVAAKFSAEKAGYYGAMQSLGHGVGWGDEGVKARPPMHYGMYDPKLSDAVWRAIQRAAREAEVPLS